MTEKEPKSHHFVQRAYLEGFQNPELEKNNQPAIWVYLPGKSPFPQRPERVAKRNYYYCHREEEKRRFDAEHHIQKLEDVSLPALRALRDGKFDVSKEERLTFAGYIALSHVRVPTFERSIDRLTSIMMAKRVEFVTHNDRALGRAVIELNKKSGENVTPEEFRKRLTGGNVVVSQTNRGWSLNQMFNMLLYLQQVIFEMNWMFLCAPPEDDGFITSDNPVALFDPLSQHGVGFASTRAAHFIFPISRGICLVAGHLPSVGTMRINPSRVRAINRSIISRADSQLYAPFKSLAVQEIFNSLMERRPPRSRVMMKKGRVVEE
jgi:uncharacterized protein DUF4238